MGTRTRLLTAAVTVTLLGASALTAPTASARGVDPSKGSISISASSVGLVDSPMTFKGVVSLKRRGIAVGLQRKVAGGWKNVSQGRTTSGGHYRLSGSVDFGGIYQFRVIRMPWLTNSAKSRVVTVSVYEWQRLDETDAGDYDDGVSFDQPATMGGVTYPNSILMDADSQGTVDGGFFEVDLTDLNCAALDTQAGALDGNAANSEVGLQVKLDGTSIANKNYHLGDTEHLTLDLRGGTTLRVESHIVLAGPQGKVGLGSPRLLCAS